MFEEVVCLSNILYSYEKVSKAKGIRFVRVGHNCGIAKRYCVRLIT